MDTPHLNLFSVCSGTAMLDEGFRLACEWHGIRVQHVGYCEREASAAAILMARMEETSLEPAPLWAGNLEDIRTDGLRGVVDGVIGGIPCQPDSQAGKQRGTEDERWLWDGFWKFAQESGAGFIGLENVGRFIRASLPLVLHDLAEAGWHAEWCHLRACEVGAGHERERIFVLAHAHGHGFRAGRSGLREPGEESSPRHEGLSRAQRADAWCGHGVPPPGGGQSMGDAQSEIRGCEQSTEGSTAGRRTGFAGASGETLAAACCQRGIEQNHDQPSGSPETPLRRGDSVAAAWSERHEGEREGGPASGSTGRSGGAEIPTPVALPIVEGPQGEGCPGPSWGSESLPFCRDWPAFAPGPGCEHWGDIIAHAPHLAPAIEPGLCVLVDGVAYLVDASRADQLRAAGNGVVALQAAVAFAVLIERLRKE